MKEGERVVDGVEDRAKILIVDDEEAFLVTTKVILEDAGYIVTTADRGEKAMDLVRCEDYDVILADIRMPGGVNGIDVIREAKKKDPHVVGIVITAYASLDTAIEAVRENCFDYIQKPYVVDDLLRRIERGLRERMLEKRVIYLKEQAEFLNDVLSHDISNINHVLKGYLELLMNTELNDEQRMYVNNMFRTLRRCENLINSANKLITVMNKAPELFAVDVIPVIEESIARIRAEYPDRKMEVRTVYECSGCIIIADEFISEVFWNLLDNAVRFSSEDVRICVRVREHENPDFYEISVEDRGKGVPDEEKQMIFERIQRQHSSEKGTSGSGIGLLLVKTLVRRYGGDVWVEDRVKGNHTEGSVFKVLLRNAKNAQIQNEA